LNFDDSILVYWSYYCTVSGLLSINSNSNKKVTTFRELAADIYCYVPHRKSYLQTALENLTSVKLLLYLHLACKSLFITHTHKNTLPQEYCICLQVLSFPALISDMWWRRRLL